MSVQVFDVSLPRTGTRSLCLALETLGYKTFHGYETEAQKEEMFDKLLTGRRDFTWLEDYDAVSHMPFAYQDFDKEFLDAKFVFLWRKEDEWLDSCKRHWSAYQTKVKRAQRYHKFDLTTFLRALNFGGCVQYDEEHFKRVRHQHTMDVFRYFSNRYEMDGYLRKLLFFNVHQGWGPLCSFLGLPIPERLKFPNATNGYKRKAIKLRLARERQQWESQQCPSACPS